MLRAASHCERRGWARSLRGRPSRYDRGKLSRLWATLGEELSRGTRATVSARTFTEHYLRLLSCPADAVAALRKAAQTLMQHFGRLDPEWGEVNRLRRGKLDLPAGGGPDTLRAIESTVEPGADGKFEANKGDTLIIFVEWGPSGKVHAESIHQFGSATLDASSPHYADQAPLYQRQEMKPVWLDEAEVRQHLEREYRPGR